jgi:thiosulfate/3-mercaptopyruvate sulfurtransferase
VLLDARDASRYAGGTDPFDPRAGHIPGAVSLPARTNVEADGRLVSQATLSARFAAAGIEPGTEVISSCGSGVTACHNLLALEAVHLGPGRLYVGSFSEWSRDPDRPVDTGE